MPQLLFRAAVVVLAAATVWAQKPDPSKAELQGNRFPPLSWETMTPEQRTMVQHILSGTRTSLGGPFNVLLRSPEMGDLAQQMGESMRFRSSIPRRLNEMAIIITARHWTSHYEWYVHRAAAAEAGLAEGKIRSIAAGERPAALDADETIVYNFCTEMLQTKQVSDATFNAVKAKFGERGIVDLIGVMGWYQMVSMALNADQYPLPAGAATELKPLR
jgi:4-carboxymuconolactone decarboxylase